MLYEELTKISLNGDIIDLGGSRRSGYHALFKGDHTITVANLDGDDSRDIICNLEQLLPLKDGSYDGVVCLNVLEHIFNYQTLLNESWRILKNDGLSVYAVPFLIQIHPSPRDHWRFTEATLERLFKETGFSDIEVRTIGTGVCGASYQLRHNLYRYSMIQRFGKACARMGDALISFIKSNSYFSKEYYPLGYIIVARK